MRPHSKGQLSRPSNPTFRRHFEWTTNEALGFDNEPQPPARLESPANRRAGKPALHGRWLKIVNDKLYGLHGSVKVRGQVVGCVGDFANASSTRPDGQGLADRTRDALLDKRNASYRWHTLCYTCWTLTESWRGLGQASEGCDSCSQSIWGSILLGCGRELVRKAGLEPAWLAPPPPQDGVSANSTTSAFKAGQAFMTCLVATRSPRFLR